MSSNVHNKDQRFCAHDQGLGQVRVVAGVQF